MGQRRGDGAGRTGGIAVSVSPARHRECETGAGARNGGARLERRRPGSFAEVLGGKREVWEYAALVTSLDSEILTLGQLYRDRADCENAFNELKSHWGWGGFTTQDLNRCRLLAASVALIYNWWSLFYPVGRSPSASRSHHQPAVGAAGDCPQNPARRPHHAGGEQHAWRPASGAAGLSAHRPVLCQLARKSGAVGCSAALVSHPQRGAAKISARPATNPASTPAARLTPPAVVASWDANRRRPSRQLPDLG